MSESVRQAILVADTLIGEYDVVLNRFMEAWKYNDEGIDQSTIRAEIERVYGATWEQLDTAAAATRKAGRACADYDRIRADPKLARNAAIEDVKEKFVGSERVGMKVRDKYQLTVKDNRDGLELARQASAALKQVWPELDFTPQETPDVD